ncbi:MAG TPA: ABC transporter ATP-binding protein [Anaerolineales bacterium]|nr:ABC transporter ATP-binding protein [Anaerolineales bacterium]
MSTSLSNLNKLDWPRSSATQPWTALFALYRQDGWKYVLATLVFGIKHSPVWAMPLVTGFVIDLLSTRPENALTQLLWAGIILLVIDLQNSPMNLLYSWLLSQAVRDLELRLRLAVSERMQTLSLSFFHKTNSGALQNKIMRDVEQIEQVTRQLFDNGLTAFWTATAAIIATAWRAPRFLIFYTLVIPLAVWIIRALREPLSEHNNQYRKALEQLAARITEMTQLLPITRAHGQEQQQLARIFPNLQAVRRSGQQLDFFNGAFGSLAWVAFQIFSGICLFAAALGYLLNLWRITVGDIVLLTTYFGQITGSVLMMTTLLPQLAKGVEAVRSLGEIMNVDELEQNNGKQVVATVQGEFVFDNVNFSYPHNPRSAIQNFNARVAAGTTVAIVGESGAGKSTLIQLILGMIAPQSGQIYLDGKNLGELDLRAYRQFVAMVSQEPILFAGSVRENVLAGKPTADEGELLSALQAANAYHFVQDLPHGLDTEIGERGASLSGGQKQRLTLARAILRNPRVLALDEATSAVDTISEQAIQQALAQITRARTTFIVAHRLTTIQNADVIWVMSKGQLVEVGTHQQLLDNGGLYARLAQHPTLVE